MAYEADGGWRVYNPETPRAETSGSPVQMEGIIVLQSEAEMASRVSPVELAAYVGVLKSTAQEHFGSLSESTGQDLAVQIEVWPDGRVDLRMASNPRLRDEILEELHNQLMRLQGPALTGGAIKFQMRFRIRGGHIG